MKRIILIGLLLAATKIYSQSVTTNAATNITQTTATLNASASGLDAGKTYKVQFYYGPSSNHYLNNNWSTTFTGATSNSFTLNITSLTTNTQYFFSSYLYEADVTPPPPFNDIYIGAGSELSFTTIGNTAPSITTTAATSITTSSVTIGGNVTSDGGATVSERGMTLSIADNNPTLGEPNVVSFVNGGTGTGTFTQALVNLKPGQIYYYNSYATNSVGTSYGTATNFTTTSITQASNIAFNNTTATQTGITFTAGGGTGRLVLAKQGSAITAVPIDGATYSSNNTFGSGTNIGDNTYVISQDISTAFTIYGLSASTAYYIQVYEYTSNGGGGYYYQPNPATGNVTALKGEPTTQATNVGFGSIMATTFTTSWTRGNGDGVIVLARAGGAVNDFPDDGITYSASTTFGSGTQLGTGNYVIYIGTGNSVNLSGLTDGTYYEIRAFEYNNSGSNINYKTSTATNNPNNATTTGLYTWQGDDGTSPSYWSVAANWDKNNVPTSTTDVVIPTGAPVMPIIFLASYACKNLTIEAGASLTINDGRTLTVNGNVLLKSPANSGAAGQLVIPGTGILTVTGTSTMERYYDATAYAHGGTVGAEGWYMSSPLEGSTPISAFGLNWIYKWTESLPGWNTNLNASSTFSEMEGALIKKTEFSTPNAQTFIFSASGAFNTGTTTINVTNSSPGNGNYGWNLVGNPYPSAINWGSVDLSGQSISASIYIYKPAISDYITCNQSTCDQSYGSPIIQPAQGFIVNATVNNQTLTFTNAMRTVGTNSFMKSGNVTNPKITIKANNSFFKTESSIFFEDDASNSGFDIKYDAYKRFSGKDSIPNIYCILNDGSKLIFNTLNTNLLESLPTDGFRIKLGFKQNIGTDVEIGISDLVGISDDYFIYLYDKSANIYTDIRVNKYSVYLDSPAENRFELLIIGNAVSVSSKKTNTLNIHIFNQEKSVFIKSPIFEQNKGEILVFDIMGRLIVRQPTENSNIQEVPLQKAGTYIIKIIVNNTVATQKVVVN